LTFLSRWLYNFYISNLNGVTMLLLHWNYCLGFGVFVLAFLYISTFYTYLVNASRAADDPQKRVYSLRTCWLAPITVPILIVFNIPAFILGGAAFIVFLILFPFMLLLFRKPILIPWIQKQLLKVGTALLEINTAMLAALGFLQAREKQAFGAYR